MTTEHIQECWLAKPCRSDELGEHSVLDTVSGIRLQHVVCEMCMDQCICSLLRDCETRVEKKIIDDLAVGQFQGNHDSDWIIDRIRIWHRDKAINDCLKIAELRVSDLTSCNKPDDCATIAKGAELVRDDIEWNLLKEAGKWIT